jgi:hypothetical protein
MGEHGAEFGAEVFPASARVLISRIVAKQKKTAAERLAVCMAEHPPETVN